ncbi:MAG: hypothetical protein ACJAWV_002697 [Flammeovirgaceae bacterium]|jgi:hypothetical protein
MESTLFYFHRNNISSFAIINYIYRTNIIKTRKPMLTDSEIVTLMQDNEVLNASLELKKEFLRAEAQFLDIGDDDFVSLMLLAPSVGIALANGSISLFEELSLNKKARFLSRGSYFLKKDPIVHGLKYLVKHFDQWEERCYAFVKAVMLSTLNKNKFVYAALTNPESTTGDLSQDILNAPYILVKFISFMFLEEEDDLLNASMISEVELKKVQEIGEKLGLGEMPLFKLFYDSFELKKEGEGGFLS